MTDAPAILPADPKASYLAYRGEIQAAVHRVLESGWYIKGEEVADFEREFAEFAGAGHAVGVASGTDALELALRTLGVGPGAAVFTVSHTAVATVAAIELAGAVPVLVDIDPERFTMCPAALQRAIGSFARREFGLSDVTPRAVVPVHLYGHPADMPEIAEIAAGNGLSIVEDCAQAHGARVAGRTVGTWGAFGTFSFYPTKNLGALGDAGSVVTNDAELARKARILAEYGWEDRYVSAVPGMNSRLDPVQAAILRVKLRHVEAENRRRREIAAGYSAALSPHGWRVPCEAGDCRHVYHQYVIRCAARDRLRTHLQAAGVGSAIHYPLPVHLQPAYSGRLPVGEPGLPCTEEICREILSLPVHPHLSDADVSRVTDALLAWPGRGV